MRVLLFFVFLAVAACADQQLKPLPADNGTGSHATESHGTAAGSTPKPSASEGGDHQQEQPVTVRPHVGGMGGLPRPPNSQPGLHFPGFGQGFVPGFGQGFIPGFNPAPLPGFMPMPQFPFPGFGR